MYRFAASNVFLVLHNDPEIPMNAVIDPTLLDEVLPALEPGEGLLWVGRPNPLRTARATIGQALIGAVFVLLFFLAYLSYLPASGPYFGAQSVPFSLRSAVLTSSSFLIISVMLLPLFSYRKAQRTVYAATDRRVLSLTRGFSVKAVRYEDMQVPLLHLGPDGSGDIQLIGKFRADGTELQPRFPAFLGVRDVESVYQVLLGRMPSADAGQAAYAMAQDYLELLFQGKRTLDEAPPRE
jgi:hypothetical protein